MIIINVITSKSIIKLHFQLKTDDHANDDGEMCNREDDSFHFIR